MIPTTPGVVPANALVNPRAGSPASILHRLEAAFWLTRPHIAFSKVPMAAAGWFLGRGDQPTSTADLLTLIVLLSSMQMLMFVVNDIQDAERDRLSAPHLPIASGMVPRPAALLLAALLATTFMATAVILARDIWLTATVLATIPAALVTMKLYSRTKAIWISPLLASTASSSFVAWAWLLAGHQMVTGFILLFAIASLHGIHANLRAQLRDIEGDPKAGTITLAVRLGAKRTLLAAAVVRAVELGAIAALTLFFGTPLGLWWVVGAAALLIVALVQAPRVYRVTRDREGQTAELFVWVYMSFLAELATVGGLRPMLALAVGAAMYVWFHVTRRLYYRRLLGRDIE
jgi:4-hydroxybenzoate polyprenyltransferase